MTTKQLVWIGIVVLLAGLCLYINRDWFSSDGIQIYHRSDQRGGIVRRGGSNRRDNTPTVPVFFGFSRKVSLKSVKVLPVSDLETNKFPHAIWHMVSDSNSVPTKGFSYGTYLPGMRPAVKGSWPEALRPGVKYRLILDAGALKADHDFVPVPKTQ